MATLKSLVEEVILEEKQKNLKVFYNIDINIKEKVSPEVPVETPVVTPPAAEVPTEPVPGAPVTTETPVPESVKHKGKLLKEADEAPKGKDYTNKITGEVSVPAEDAMNIQTINDLVEYLSGQDAEIDKKKSPVEKALDKKTKKVKAGKVISSDVQDIILILTGVSGEASALGDIISKEDKIIIELKYGNNPTDNIGLKINKNSGTDVASTSIVKDGELLPGKFDPALINKYILFYRNSLA